MDIAIVVILIIVCVFGIFIIGRCLVRRPNTDNTAQNDTKT